MKTLYLECDSGISGDMLVAALLDLGADEDVLKKALSGITDKGFSYKISRVSKNGLDCCDFDVILDKEHDNHDHDMNYLYGHLEGHGEHDHHHDHGHEHEHEHEHHHDDEHEYEYHHDDEHEHHHDDEHEHHHDDEHDHHHEHEHGHHHHHEHRNLKDVITVIEKLELTDRARGLAIRVFEILAEAEAKAHGKSIDEVHFHEVGAIDSIADIVAASVCFDNLGITDVIIPKLCEGTGSVRCQHGILPVPVPAVLNIASAHQLPVSIINRKGELITPTGAAFAAAVMTSSKLPEVIIPEKVGLGAGKREYERPSIVRAVLLKDRTEEDGIWKLETNIDDSTGEQLGFTMECLLKAGARDVFYSPVYMKKNRPAWLLSVIAEEKDIPKLEEIIFRETTTIGIRRQKVERTVLPRRKEKVETAFGTLEVKVCGYEGSEKVYPEYESAAEIARKQGIPLEEVYAMARNSFNK